MSKKKVTLRAMFSFPLQVKLFRDRAAAYARLHPELDLSFDIPDSQLGTTERLIRSLALGRQEADILDLHTNFEIPLVQKGSLREHFLDLTDEVQEVKSGILGWEPCTWHGRIYALPAFLSATVFYYRSDVFEKLKIDPDAFTGWQDFIQAGLKIKRDLNSYIIALDLKSYNQLQPLALHAGGGYFSSEGRLCLDTPENRSALALYQALLLKHEIALPAANFYGPETWSAYRSGQLVGAYMPEWYGSNEMLHKLSDMEGRFRIAVAPPFSPGGFRSGSRGGMCACVVRGPNQDIALDFLKYARLTMESQVALFRNFLVAPSLLQAYEQPEVRDLRHHFLGNQQVAAVYRQAAAGLKQFHVGPQLLEVQNVVNASVMPALCQKGADPATILKAAQQEVQDHPIGVNEALKIEGENDLSRGGDVK
jgi:ABC-type glycerol-3-phosphate transport system substrate-binding protein